MRVKVKPKIEVKSQPSDPKRHAVGLMKCLAKTYPADFLKIAKKIESAKV